MRSRNEHKHGELCMPTEATKVDLVVGVDDDVRSQPSRHRWRQRVLLQNFEHIDCFVLLAAFFTGHFLNEAIRFEVIDDLVGSPA